VKFPKKLGYGHKALLREAALRIIRLGYLLDFMTLNSLFNIYNDSMARMLK